MIVCLFVCLAVCLFVCLFVCLYVCLFIYSTEHQIFKLRFADWEDVMKVDFTKTTEMIEKRAIELVWLI